MRLFIAINFNDETRASLLALRDELQGKSERGNFTAPKNLHLTLAFLGECSDTQAVAAKVLMDAIAFEPFAINIDSIGRFKRDRGDLWWAGLHENSKLTELHSDLCEKLARQGSAHKKRRFNPHITLGREIVTNTKPWNIEPFGETVSSIELMKSERVNGVLTYTAIHSTSMQ